MLSRPAAPSRPEKRRNGVGRVLKERVGMKIGMSVCYRGWRWTILLIAVVSAVESPVAPGS